MDETVVSGGAKRRHLSQRLVTCWPQLGYIYTLAKIAGWKKRYHYGNIIIYLSTDILKILSPTDDSNKNIITQSSDSSHIDEYKRKSLTEKT